MLRTGASLLLILFLVVPNTVASEPTLSDVMQRLKNVADGYPPKVAESERAEIIALWTWAESGLLEYRNSRPAPDENAEFLLGEIYRFGHNLDIDGSNAKAIEHFRAAIKLNPQNPKYHLLLGRHLTFSNQLEAGRTELLLSVALDPSGAGDQALFVLTHNAYYLKEFAMAAAFAERYLKMHPEDESIRFLLEMSRKVLGGGAVPRTIPVPAE